MIVSQYLYILYKFMVFINVILCFQVLPTDTLPLNICFQCLMKLNSSYELVIMALNSEAKLKAKFDLTEDPSLQLEVFLLLFFSCIECVTEIKCFRRW